MPSMVFALLGVITAAGVLFGAAVSLHFTKLMRDSRASAVTKLTLVGAPLRWHHLDDGVMGGRSQTVLSTGRKSLEFAGTINTQGGGFASARAEAPDRAPLLPESARALRLRLRGDGLQYKVLLSKGGGGPFSAAPSWQHDVKTKRGVVETVKLELKDFLPSFGGSAMRRNEHVLLPVEMRELGLMLSLKDAQGQPNPHFGEGVFDFGLSVESVDVVT